MKISQISTVFVFLISLFLFVSCEKDGDYDYRSRNIYLSKPVIKDGKVFLSWNKPLCNNFRYYIISRSNQPINEGGYFNNSTYIENIDSTTFLDSGYLLEDTIYYKVSLVTRDSVIQSNTEMVVVPIPTVLSFTPNIILANNIDNKVVFIYSDWSNCRIAVYDVLKDSITAIANNLSYTINNLCILGTNNLEAEIYFIDQSNSLIILDANTLKKKAKKQLSFSVCGMTTDNKGHIFIADYWNIYTLNKSDLSMTNSNYNCSSTYNLQYSDLTNEIISPSSYTIYKYALDNNGMVKSGSYVDFNEYINSNSFKIIQGSNYFLYNSGWQISAAEFNTKEIVDLNQSENNSDYYILNNFVDQDYIVSCFNASNTIRLYSSSSFQIVSDFRARANPFLVARTGNYVVACENLNLSSGKTIIERFNIK